MSSYNKSSFSAIRKSFQLVEGLPFADVLSERDVQKAFDDAECRFGEDDDAIFTPAVTLWAFLSQMLFAGAARSCDAARVEFYIGLVGLCFLLVQYGGNGFESII